MRPSMQLSSRRAGHRIDCAASRSGVDGAAFPVALLGLILWASMIACADAKADVGMSQRGLPQNCKDVAKPEQSITVRQHGERLPCGAFDATSRARPSAKYDQYQQDLSSEDPDQNIPPVTGPATIFTLGADALVWEDVML